MNKNESKYSATAKRMDEALITLLGEKDLEYITVKSICETAGVNRSTFYLHYETIQDLLSETTEYMSKQFFSYFEDKPEDFVPKIKELPLDSLVLVCDKHLVPYLKYVSEHRNVFAAAFAGNKVMHTHERADDLFRYVFSPIMGRFNVPENLRFYYNEFFLKGTVAIIAGWLKNGCRETPEEISNIIENLCVRGFKAGQ